MGFENQNSDSHLSTVAFEIEFDLGDILDSYRIVQDDFFAACRQYAADFSSKNYEAVEDTAYSLELGLVGTIHAIAERQQTSEKKIRMAHGFMLADDTMRTELFRELVPGIPFQAFAETEGASYLDHNVITALERIGETRLLASLATSATTFLNADVLTLGEAVAVGSIVD
jgi:hypothetical protein